MTREQVAAEVAYDPETGVFTRRNPQRKTKVKAGATDSKGHVQVRIGGRLIGAHRLAWLLMTGRLPEHQVDHINGDRSDNRWCNLREATASENAQNRAPHVNNKCGHIGVHWCKKRRKWVAQVRAKGHRPFAAGFDTQEAAIAAYLEAKARLHTFSPRPRQRDGALWNAAAPAEFRLVVA